MFLYNRRMWVIGLILAVWVCMLVYEMELAARDHVAIELSSVDERIARLIEQLGDDRYTTRERAQAELGKLGFKAFESLSEAQSHEDVEIAQRARYLIRSMRIDWTWNEDPPAVKTILKGYEQQGSDQRVRRMKRLAQLKAGEGIEALCRLARFERTDGLSKEAALLIIGQPHPEEKAECALRSRIIKVSLGPSQRTGAKWLRVYAHWLREPVVAVGEWEQIVTDERELLQISPERSSRKIVCHLLRRQAEMLRDVDQFDEAIRVTRTLFEHLDPEDEIQILETVDWLAQQQAWSLIVEGSHQFPHNFGENALLGYRLAQAYRASDDATMGSRVAAEALERHPKDVKKHEIVALELQRRGLVEWAEREYRHVIDLGPPASPTFIQAHISLAEMLHDLTREFAAAQALESLITSLEANRDERISSEQLRDNLAPHRSRMHYFFAAHFAQQNDRDQQRKHLNQAITIFPTDADVLIAMHHFPDNDEKWRTDLRGLINVAVTAFRRAIQASPDDPKLYNQLAWLVSNTEGDFDEALKCSQKSLEFYPNQAGFLDTLARCYFAKGDLDSAIKHQTQAAQLEPYTMQIQRQLEFFRREQKR